MAEIAHNDTENFVHNNTSNETKARKKQSVAEVYRAFRALTGFAGVVAAASEGRCLRLVAKEGVAAGAVAGAGADVALFRGLPLGGPTLRWP